jgi:hypothetical protein
MSEKHNLQAVPLTDLRPGPFRHEQLTFEQRKLARHIYESCGHYYYSSFEQWEMEFLRDVHPDQELHLWHAIAQSFERLRLMHPNMEERKLLGQVLRCATGGTLTQSPEIPDIYISVCKEIATKRDAVVGVDKMITRP